MATTDKNFRVKNGLVVEGNQITLGSTPVAFNSASNQLEIYINGVWEPIALVSQVPSADDISWQDIGLAIDYDGQPVYTVQANGVVTTATKFADGGTPTSTSASLVFDSGEIA